MLREFITTGMENKNTEFKLYTIGHSLKKYIMKYKLKKQLKIRNNIKIRKAKIS